MFWNIDLIMDMINTILVKYIAVQKFGGGKSLILTKGAFICEKIQIIDRFVSILKCFLTCQL